MGAPQTRHCIYFLLTLVFRIPKINSQNMRTMTNVSLPHIVLKEYDFRHNTYENFDTFVAD
ncbi:hypothetical protein KDAU_61050 [Dictyobacter aurantiacus]|uniref:Uncharacterized protein n=1 Tax=Dictyobacter aurantiacus TaxID=1936993 RepID=A0A401ZPU3_9CHLR|nr:hypothetical protein KDAU_61050 [Dictyobacter aurantiacus]